jgi:hypothetical protein
VTSPANPLFRTLLDKIRKERKNEVCVTFAREGSKPLTDREHTLDAIVRREVL